MKLRHAAKLQLGLMLGAILMISSACAPEPPGPSPLIEELASAKSVTIRAHYDSTPVEWTVTDAAMIKDLASKLTFSAKPQKVTERLGTTDVITVMVDRGGKPVALLTVLDRDRLMYGPESQSMVKLRDCSFHESIMKEALTRLPAPAQDLGGPPRQAPTG